MSARSRWSVLALIHCLLFATVSLAQNARLAQVDMPRYIRVGQAQVINGHVSNAGPGSLMGFNVGWRWNGGEVHMGQTMSISAGLGGSNMAMFTHPVAFSLPSAQEGVLQIWVDGTNERDRSNDTLTMYVTALEHWAEKHVLLEVRTSLNCHNCQQARPRMDALARYPRIEMGMFHHEDPLTVEAVDKTFGQYGADMTPACVMDQGELGGYDVNANHSQWNAHLKGRLEGVSPVLCWVDPVFDPATRKVTVSITSQFTTALKGEFTVNAMVLMNDLYGQGGAGSPYYHTVVRGLLSGATGHTTAIPNEPSPGTNYKLTYVFDLPANSNPDQFCFTGFVTQRHDGKNLTLNARTASLRTLAKGEVADRIEDTLVAPLVSSEAPAEGSDPTSGDGRGNTMAVLCDRISLFSKA